jgi:hypothetical protein
MAITAVFAVHEFLTDRADRRKKVPRNRADYERFVRVLLDDALADVRPGNLCGPVGCVTPSGQKVGLLVGKAVDDWAAEAVPSN